jgi:hypothetical protein
MATMFWAMSAAFLGRREIALHARAVYLEEVENARAEWAISWGQWCAGLTELRFGEPAHALHLLRESIIRQRAIQDEWGPTWNVEALAWTAAAVGHHQDAAVLLGAAHRMRKATGIAMIGLAPFHTAHLEAEHQIRQALTEQAYADAWEQGATTHDGIGLALATMDRLSAALGRTSSRPRQR